jgi:single-stranded DNA-binding protein
MAKIEIESAFVEAWTKNAEEHPSWGMKTAEPHSRKNEEGKYETVSRTFRTIKVPRSTGIDLTIFRKGDRVQVWGREVTETREHEGKKFYDLVVWADRVEIVDGRSSSQAPADATNDEPWATTPPASTEAAGDVWNTPGGYSDETPFG